MNAEKARDLRWLRLYKLIACVGVAAIIPPVFDGLSFWIARQYSTAGAVLLVPLLLSVGYAIQSLFLTGRRRDESGTIDHGFEADIEKIPLARKAPAMALATIAGIIAGAAGKSVFQSLLGDDSNVEFGFPLFLAACVLTAIGGCLLGPLKFHQILSIRTVIGTLFVFSLVFAFEIVTGTDGGVDLLFVSCFFIYALCLCILMNQEYVTKPASTFDTCHATPRLRTAGIMAVVRLVATVILFQIPILSSLSLVVIPFRFFKYFGVREIFQFPVKGAVALNIALFAGGFVMIAAAVVRIIAKACRVTGDSVRELIANIAGRIREAVLRLFGRLFGKKAAGLFRAERPLRLETPHYVDVLTYVAPKKAARMPVSYSSFRKRLKSCRTDRERFCFAYRVLVGHLCAADIGIKRAFTPLEMVKAVESRTDIGDFERLTGIFIAELYGDAGTVSPEDVSRISDILRSCLMEH